MNRWTAATRRVYFSSGHGRQPRAPFSPRASPSFPRNGRHASHNSRRGDNRRGDNSRRQPRRHRHDGAAAKRAWKHAASFSAKVGAAKFPDRSARASHARNGGGEATAPAATTTVAAEKRMNRLLATLRPRRNAPQRRNTEDTEDDPAVASAGSSSSNSGCAKDNAPVSRPNCAR